jgi:hypothetical protein
MIVVQVNSQESRTQLESSSGPFSGRDLSESDRMNIRTLSDSLNINEEISMNLLALAHSEGRPVNAEHAAHIYLEERCNLLQAFNRMLHIKLGYLAPGDPTSTSVVEQVIEHLTSAKVESAAGWTALSRLCTIAEVSPCVQTIVKGGPATLSATSEARTACFGRSSSAQ